MPLPQYVPFRQKLKRSTLYEVTGGMSPGEVLFEVERGARFVVFDYVISVLIVAYLRQSPVCFLRSGQSALKPGLPYALLSFLFGWWNFPWGLIRTPQRIYETLRGGRDITQSVVANIKSHLHEEARWNR